VFAGCSVLCWQPALVFGGGALWAALADDRGGRTTRAVRLALGSATVPALLLAFFAFTGALGQFFAQAVGFNLAYIELHARTPLGTVKQLYELTTEWNAVELLLLPAALLGAGLGSLRPGALAAAGLGYLALSFISFQSWTDMIMMAPFIAAALGVGLTELARLAGSRILGNGLALGLAFTAALASDNGRTAPRVSWYDQVELIERLASGLAPEDRVLVVSYPELLIHTGRHSVWPYPYLWFGVDRFADHHTPGGFPALVAALDRDPPALMIVARRWGGPHRREFERWARQHYTREQIYQWPHTVRPIGVYRPIRKNP
jgi:hypothetical protein